MIIIFGLISCQTWLNIIQIMLAYIILNPDFHYMESIYVYFKRSGKMSF